MNGTLQAWKKDFRKFYETTYVCFCCLRSIDRADSRNTMKMQLFGINRSSVPLLIFHRELLPLAHFWDGLGDFGRSYACTLARRVWKCRESELWIDPVQGTLIRGVQGPDHDIYHFSLPAVTLPSSVELLLQEDVCFRYFSRLPLDKEFDKRAIDVLHFAFGILGEEIPPIISRPYVLSTKTNSIIAVGSAAAWYGYDGCLDGRVVMPDGKTRFTLTDEGSDLKLYSFGNTHAWMSQASSVFHRLGISLDDNLSSYEFVLPSICFTGSIEDSQRRLEDQPIYFFLHPVPEHGVPTHTWSYDENGEIPIPRHQCKDLGLPTELSTKHVSRRTRRTHRWPSKTYKYIHKWQIARGFDPTTTDFARYLEYPIYEVRPSESGRFEELCAADASEAPHFTGPSLTVMLSDYYSVSRDWFNLVSNHSSPHLRRR
ncbi:hypothetical protein E1B28_005229 [Marasmius oreades]|uniref:Uncharacterized protein n=1 Tax=Marasmius oreades TaxID=181124 RepID=A0A9P8ADX0_9AGAR|nr:uncharacterized protein E1B28_005229 [Marasmius oreades]KAG7097918.1 hypothetical protein E1B28_005229 [Marasmius oreades]